MNKTELIAAVAEKANISKKDSELVVNATIDSIVSALKDGETAQPVAFGPFEAKHRAARTRRTPKTKATITIPASNTPAFKAGKALKDAVAK